MTLSDPGGVAAFSIRSTAWYSTPERVAAGVFTFPGQQCLESQLYQLEPDSGIGKIGPCVCDIIHWVALTQAVLVV